MTSIADFSVCIERSGHICTLAAKNSSCVSGPETPSWTVARRYIWAETRCIFFFWRPDQIAGCCTYSIVHLTFHPQHWLSVSPFYNRPSAMTSLRLFWEITCTCIFSDLATQTSGCLRTLTYRETLIGLGVLIGIGILSFVSSHLSSWDIFFNCVDYFEKLRAFCTQRTHLGPLPLFGPLPANSRILTYIDTWLHTLRRPSSSFSKGGEEISLSHKIL